MYGPEDARLEPAPAARTDTQQRYSFYRARLPWDRAYPLERSALDAALDAAGVTQVAHVHYSVSGPDGVVVEVVFTGEALSWTGRPDHFARDDGTAQLTIYGVPSHHRRDVEAALRREGLPALCAWLRRAESAGNVWRASMHRFTLRYADGRSAIEER